VGWFAANDKKLVRRVVDIRAGFGKVGATVSLPLMEDAAQVARALVHIRTGYTQGTIQAELVNQFAARLTASGPGALAEEYGTRFRPPHPFLAPAVAQVQPDAARRYKSFVIDLFGDR
jgi:hypothetical protein